MSSITKTIQNTINNWWIPLLVGIIFIATGIYTFMQPQDAYVALVIVFTAAFIVSGIAEIVFAISNRKYMDNWGWLLIFGIITTIGGVLLAMNPSISAMTLPFYIGFVVLFRSIAAISLSLDFKDRGILDWGTIFAMGILGVIFSFILLWNPDFAGMTAVVWTGVVLLFAGIFSIYFAIKLKGFKNNIQGAVNQFNKMADSVKESVKNVTGDSND